ASRALPRRGRGATLPSLLALLLTTLVFQLEPGPQQRARIIRHAPQPGLVGDAAFTLRGLVRAVGAFIPVLAVLRALPLQRALHALALRRFRLALLCFAPCRILPGLAPRLLRLLPLLRFVLLLRLVRLATLVLPGICLPRVALPAGTRLRLAGT